MFIINKIGNIKDNDKLFEKSIKPKIRKLFKSLKLAKLGNKLSKSENSPYFKTKKDRPNFFIFKTRIAFYYLWLIFIKISIF